MSNNRLPTLVSQIKNKLNEAFRALKRTLEFYREAGRLLRKAKRELKAYSRQPWKAWLLSADGPGIEPRVAQFYMRLDRFWDKIHQHPDYTPEMGYLAALKLVRKRTQKVQHSARCGSSTCSTPDGNMAVSNAQPDEREILQPPIVLPIGLPPSSGAGDFPQDTPMPEPSQEDRGLPQQAQTPVPPPATTEVVPSTNVFNVTAKLRGDADLAVTTNRGFDLRQVLEMVRKREAVVQAQSDIITLPDATVIATFKVLRQNYDLDNLAATVNLAA